MTNHTLKSPILLKQFRTQEGCLAYAVGDWESRRLCLIDPRMDEFEEVLNFVSAHGMTIDWVIDTHTHADHYSSSHLFAQKCGAAVGMAPKSKSERRSRILEDGQWIDLGPTLKLQSILTPGHTPDSLCVIAKWGPLSSQQAVFTGDTLFIGGSGRTDFPGASAAEQYDSIHRVLGALPNETWVFPGHDYSDLAFSTIGAERASNPDWIGVSEEEFCRRKEAEVLESGNIIQRVLQFNMQSAPATSVRGGSCTACAVASVAPRDSAERKSAQEFQEALSRHDDQSLFIDVREPEEFLAGHIGGVQNIPMGELVLLWDKMVSMKKIYFTCQRGNRSMVALRSCQRLGLKQVADLKEGYLGWVGAGLPTVR